ncbi:AAA family ATPase [Mucilaginibacter angelicae]|uniref:AAA family ATPase n=1 Tax=Mucilaginibacter angelicae TaxID=869718 RepID=A0ABV6KZU3_9SPHI
MYIKNVIIENFKCFNGLFKLKLNEGVNILVGDNEAGKSTILEAIHLALTGMLHGRYLKNELTQYIFNSDVVSTYITELETKGIKAVPPQILIEIIMAGDGLAEFEGDGNKERIKQPGFGLKILFDDKYQEEYEKLVKNGGIKTLPIEYYQIQWTSFARDEGITPRSIPIKSALIDSASNRHQNGSDIYISRIIKEFLDEEEIVKISQSHRQMKEYFMAQSAIQTINEKIKKAAKITEKQIELSVELSSKNAWENSLMTYLDNIPFHYIGKGEQCIIKTKLALGHKKAKQANIILLEEPENHLSHSKLNQLIKDIQTEQAAKQVLISTHSSFVANKLGLENLILLHNQKTVRLNDLDPETQNFFQKLSGYDTLRLILCKKAILVEGDSDELIVQKAFIMQNGVLPIEKGIDVISVGTSFLRFMEIAAMINKPVTVVTDNDGDPKALLKKYEDYSGVNVKENIKICYDEKIDKGDLKIGDKAFNYNTLEPKMLAVNSLKLFNTLFKTTYKDVNDMHRYMRSNKTECALALFDAQIPIQFPSYILEAIK